MKNTYRPWGLIVCVVLCAVLAIGFKLRSNARLYHYDATIAVTVHSGDSLWDIAKPYSENRDIRRVIDIIQEESGCGATIHSGDILRVPVFD